MLANIVIFYQLNDNYGDKLGLSCAQLGLAKKALPN